MGEMESRHDPLLPPGERHERARSLLFSIAVVPTGENSFDAEYLLQLDFGGNLPHWMTSSLVVDAIKKMFIQEMKPYFGAGEGGDLDKFLKEEKARQESFPYRNGILFTP